MAWTFTSPGQTQPDSVVAAVAWAQQLPFVAPQDRPPFGTYWEVRNSLPCVGAPLPWPPFATNTPVYALGGGEFLADETVGALVAPLPSAYRKRDLSAANYASILQAQAAELQDFIGQVQAQQLSAQPGRSSAMSAQNSDLPPLPLGETGGSTNSWETDYTPKGLQHGTNELWLEITNVAIGLAYLNLHHGTNQVYAIWSTTNLALPFSQWQVATEVFPTNTDCQSFTLLTQGWQTQFARAEDWTGVTTNGNTVPQWWFWFYYGTTALSDTNLDCYGNQLIYDYTNQYDPIGLVTYSLTVQTCRGTPAAIALSGYDCRGDDPSNFVYTILTAPTNGYLTGMAPHLTYNSGTNFTGMDSFTYQESRVWGGDSVTGMVSIVVGDQNIYANWLTVMTGTNQPINLVFSASDYSDSCTDDTNNYIYTIVSEPASGTLGELGAHCVYTPNPNFEGIDSFNFVASDGVWTSSSPGTVTICVVAGPTNVTAQCRFNQIMLNWGLDDPVQAMIGQGLIVMDYRIYRATAHGGPYALIGATPDNTPSQMTYLDASTQAGTNYYYVVTFRYENISTGVFYESPYSGEASAGACSLPPPLRAGFDQIILAPNDDNHTGDGESGDLITNLLATIGFPINFYGTTYTNAWINNNGNVTFSNRLDAYTPEALANLQATIIAPFWADVDTRGTLSGLVTYGTNPVNGHAAFGANWIDVGYYGAHDDKLNVFQLVLISRPDRTNGDYDVEFNYAQIQWEAGDVSGGVDGLWTEGQFPPGCPARAGFAGPNGSSFELNGSGTNRALLDTNIVTGLIRSNYNSGGVLGRYVYPFHNGTNSLAHH